MDRCSCYHEREETKYLTEFEKGVYFANTGKLVDSIKEVVEYCCGTKECERCKCKGDPSKCDFYPEKRKKAIREKYDTKADKELLFWLRTHMTSITRYVFNNNPQHEEEYRKLAKNAVNEILFLINGEKHNET